MILALVLMFQSQIAAQTVHEAYHNVPALLRIGPEPERQIQMTERGHTLILPDNTLQIAGVAIFFQRGRIPVEPSHKPDSGSFDAEAFARGVAVLHVSTGNPLDFFFADSTMQWVSEHIEEVLTKYDLRDVPVYFAGLSLGGTRALRLAQFLVEHADDFWLHPAAVAVVDAPLDWERFWHSAKRAAKLGFHAAAADEGRWVSYLLNENLGGSPAAAPDSYLNYSVYTHSAPDGGRARLLRDIPVRAYDEPDVNWWIENRRKSYYGMNSIDLAGLINELRILGNEDAELVTSHQQRSGYAEGSSPHTWSIVDNAKLVEWFLSQSHSGAGSRK